MPNSAHPSDDASSRDSATPSAARTGRKRDADVLARRLSEKLGGDAPISLSEHQSAAKTLAKLRERILDDGQALTPRGAQLLLGAGVMAHRRATRSARVVAPTVLVEDANQQTQQEKDVRTQEDEAESELLAATSKLVFVLLCVLEQRAWEDGDTALAAVSDVAALEAADAAALDPLLLPRPNRRTRKRARGEDDDPKISGVVDEVGLERWRVVLAYVAAPAVERSALRIGARSLSEKRSEAGRWRERMDALGPRFYRAAAERLAVGMLLPDGDRDFCTLDAASIARSDAARAERLLGIVQAGESEAGQGVARALMLSLCLPASVVGVRRTLLLSRQAYTAAGVDHPKVVERAHQVAMAGVEWIWDHAEDDVERTVSLLTGLAMMTTKGDDDPIRKAVAFGGRLQLPFFEVPPPDEGAALRICFVAEHQRWVLYRLDRKGLPTVRSSQRGFEGLCNAALLLAASLR